MGVVPHQEILLYCFACLKSNDAPNIEKQDIKKKGMNIKDACITAQESKKMVRQVESNASFLSRIDVSNSHKGKVL